MVENAVVDVRVVGVEERAGLRVRSAFCRRERCGQKGVI